MAARSSVCVLICIEDNYTTDQLRQGLATAYSDGWKARTRVPMAMTCFDRKKEPRGERLDCHCWHTLPKQTPKSHRPTIASRHAAWWDDYLNVVLFSYTNKQFPLGIYRLLPTPHGLHPSFLGRFLYPSDPALSGCTHKNQQWHVVDVSVCDSFLTIVQARISRRWKTLPRLPAQILCENREPDHNDVATDLRAISCQWWCVRKQKSLSVFMGDFYSNVMPV